MPLLSTGSAATKKSPTASSENVRVVVRCRPLNRTEKENSDPDIVTIDSNAGSVLVRNPLTNENKGFTFDGSYDLNSTQKEVYDQCARPIVDSVLNGYNGTIFAYGQTGTGKTHTMEGVPDDETLRGLMPNAFNHIFETINGASSSKSFLVRASFLEIYKDDVFDLLSTSKRQKMEVKEDKNKGVYVRDLSTYNVACANDLLKVLKVGQKQRKVGATKMNEGSSRSHSMLTITIESSETLKGETGKETIQYKVGKLHLVDLAGSERQKKTEASGDRLDEAKSINWSLTVLGNCIKALITSTSSHVPYRDSKLTRLLQDSLGGNTKTCMVAAIGPASSNFEETVSTLRYADRAKQIKNKPTINEDSKDTLMREMRDEIEKLKNMLANRKGGMSMPLASLTSPIVISADDHEKMQSISSLPADMITEQIIEKVVEVDSGITAERLAAVTDEAERELLKLKSKTALESKREKQHVALVEQTTAEQEKALMQKQSQLSAEEKEMEAIAQMIRLKEQQLLSGGEQLQLAEQRKRELEQIESELNARKKKQQELRNELAEADEAEAAMEQHYSSIADELQQKTIKIRKVWEKYGEKKSELAYLTEEFETERSELLETIQSLSKELKIQTFMTEYFIPSRYLNLIESRAEYDTYGEQWIISGSHLLGQNESNLNRSAIKHTNVVHSTQYMHYKS